jgi:predicted dehydrogenase
MALWLAGAKPVSAVGASRIARNDPHGDSHDVFSVTYEFADGLILNHRGEHLRNRFEFHCECVAHCQTGYLETSYAGPVRMLGTDTGWRGGEVTELYQRGARKNIATFHDSIKAGNFTNPTIEPGIAATLAVMLGREACLKRTRLTWDDMLKEDRRIEANLKGLKA